MRINRIERVRDLKESHGSERWLTGFTDLTTLLLAFFILLFSATQVKNSTWIKASESMRSSFGGHKQVTEATGNGGEAKSEKTWLTTDQEPGLDLNYLGSLVKKQLQSDPVLKDMETSFDQDAILIALPVETSFLPGTDDLSEQGQVVIAHLSQFLNQLPNTVELVGHADPTAVDSDGRFGSNWHLSLARAYAVGQVLKNLGYQRPIEVYGRGTGDTDLLPKNLPEDVRNEKARRVDIRLNMLQP